VFSEHSKAVRERAIAQFARALGSPLLPMLVTLTALARAGVAIG